MNHLFRVRLMHRCGYPLADMVTEEFPTPTEPGWARVLPVGKIAQTFYDPTETYTWRCRCGATVQARDDRLQEVWVEYLERHADAKVWRHTLFD